MSKTIIPVTYLDGGIEFLFFHRPECGEVNQACMTNIAENDKVRILIQINPMKEDFIGMMEALKQKNLNDYRS